MLAFITINCGVSDVDYLFLKLRQHFYFCRARFFSQPE